MKKLNTFWKCILLSVGIVGILAIMDILGYKSGLFKEHYTGTFNLAWWSLYHSYALILLFILPVFYYFTVKKDLSESFALFASSWLLWNFGLEDVLYYFFQGIPLDATLPWLNNMFFVGGISRMLGYATVTSTTLIISVIVGFITVYFTSKILLKVN